MNAKLPKDEIGNYTGDFYYRIRNNKIVKLFRKQNEYQTQSKYLSHKNINNNKLIYDNSNSNHTNSKYLKCWYTNATSLENKLNEIKIKVSLEKYDILFITETCLLRSDLKTRESITIRDFVHSEQVRCEIDTINETILLGCIYRPPERSVSAVSEEINRSLRIATSLMGSGKYQGLLICGDFNFRIQWMSDGSHELFNNSGPVEEQFIETLNDSFLSQCLTHPTFQLEEGVLGNTLDLIV